RNLYNGFQPLETDKHIFVVIGGPVLCFRDNLFLTGNYSFTGTKSIYERWRSGTIQWDEDLSGPFVVFVVDKHDSRVTCITDLMMFIPVYYYDQNDNLMFGTHVDALAKAANREGNFDFVSLWDFILNGVVTYPYTVYKNILQCYPATVHDYMMHNDEIKEKELSSYWQPNEDNLYSNIKEVVKALRGGLEGFVNKVTEGMTHVALLISAGEDSRAIAGLLPQRLKRDAFIFLDFMNREGKIAQKLAKAYDINFNPNFRSETYYCDILTHAIDLIGSGYQYIHAHILGFYRSCGIDQYDAVFGGFLSDTLLKGYHVKKFKGYGKLPFLPQIEMRQYSPVETGMKAGKKLTKVYNSILKRRINHLSYVSSIRSNTKAEWFHIWPLSMHKDMPFYYSNRRRFRIYEPYTSKESVKVCASAPTSWKLNRRLFNNAFHNFLKPSRWIFHNKGFLPYFPWWVHNPIQFFCWLGREIGTKSGLIKGNQGPWGDWDRIIYSKKWEEAVTKYKNAFKMLKHVTNQDFDELMLEKRTLSRNQKINLLQILYTLSQGN
ncbi:MAG: hypothetical protein ACOC80_04275, partial [Petrotogales bacterium]